MSRCEDYPCCGHGTDQWGNPDCPDSKGRFKCVECGRPLLKTATSSICARCLRKMQRRCHDDPYGDFDMSMN